MNGGHGGTAPAGTKLPNGQPGPNGVIPAGRQKLPPLQQAAAASGKKGAAKGKKRPKSAMPAGRRSDVCIPFCWRYAQSFYFVIVFSFGHIFSATLFPIAVNDNDYYVSKSDCIRQPTKPRWGQHRKNSGPFDLSIILHRCVPNSCVQIRLFATCRHPRAHWYVQDELRAILEYLHNYLF